MPRITAIKAQVKDANRFSIFLDGQYGFSLTADQLATSSLASGQELNQTEIEDWSGRSAYGKAMQAAYRLLSYRSRSRQELTDRLGRKGYDQATIAQVLDRLAELGLINDEQLAQSSVQQPLAACRSRRRLSQDLRRRGIGCELSDQVIGDLDDDHDLEAIRRQINKKTAKQAIERPKLESFLARQGFAYGLIRSVLDQEFSENR